MSGNMRQLVQDRFDDVMNIVREIVLEYELLSSRQEGIKPQEQEKGNIRSTLAKLEKGLGGSPELMTPNQNKERNGREGEERQQKSGLRSTTERLSYSQAARRTTPKRRIETLKVRGQDTKRR